MDRLPDSFFVTGTDTGVGKTYVANQIVRGRRAAGQDCVAMKPICCGDRIDAELLHAACGGTVEMNEVNPLWLRTPVAPYVAAMVEARPLDPRQILDAFAQLKSRHREIVVEGVGGWRVPISRDYFVADLAFDIGLPVVVIVANRLGALNHALLTVDAVRARGLQCAGVILNHVQPRSEDADVAVLTNAAALGELLSVPVLGEWPYGGTVAVSI